MGVAVDGGVTLECQVLDCLIAARDTAARDLLRRVRADLADRDIPKPVLAVQIDVSPRVERLLNDHR